MFTSTEQNYSELCFRCLYLKTFIDFLFNQSYASKPIAEMATLVIEVHRKVHLVYNMYWKNTCPSAAHHYFQFHFPSKTGH